MIRRREDTGEKCCDGRDKTVIIITYGTWDYVLAFFFFFFRGPVYLLNGLVKNGLILWD